MDLNVVENLICSFIICSFVLLDSPYCVATSLIVYHNLRDKPFVSVLHTGDKPY